MNNNQFGKKLKELRKAKGLTQETLAEKADIDEKHLSRIENGKYFPTYLTLTRLLKALDTSIEETGLELEKVDDNKSSTYLKAVQILNSTTNENELNCYLEALKLVQKTLKINKD